MAKSTKLELTKYILLRICVLLSERKKLERSHSISSYVEIIATVLRAKSESHKP